MNYKEYAILAAVTNSKEATPQDNLEHCWYGLVTEMGELVDALKRKRFYKKEIDLVNLVEEIGDVCWYLTLGVTALEAMGIKMVDMDFYEQEFNSGEFKDMLAVFKGADEKAADLVLAGVLSIGAAEAGDMLMPITKIDTESAKVVNHLMEVIHSLLCFAGFMGISMDQAREANIKKLEARYPDGFSTHRALVRNLEVERATLEESTT